MLVGGSKDNRLLGPLARWGVTRTAALGAAQRVVTLLTAMRWRDLETLREMLEAGSVRPIIERTYELGDIREALDHVGGGDARAKAVIRIP